MAILTHMWEPHGAVNTREGIGEAPVDVPRHLTAIRRGARLAAAIVIPLTLAVLVLSLLLPDSYRATTTLVLDEPAGVLDSGGAETEVRRLATVQELLTSRDVLAEAADDLPGEDERTLEDKVDVSVEDAASIVRVRATDGTAADAAAIANAVAGTYLDRDRADERRRLAQARTDLQDALDRLRDAGGGDAEIGAIRERLSQLSVSEASVGRDLRIAEAARPPEEPHAPRPLQNTLFAFFAAVFVAILAALVRDALAPRVQSPRELTRLTGLRTLAVLPRRPRRRQTEDALHAARTLVGLDLPPGGQVLLVAPALGDRGPAVAAGLGRAFAEAGHSTAVVDADLERPAVHRHLRTASGPGLAELLEGRRGGATPPLELVRTGPDSPDFLPAGTARRHPAALLDRAAIGELADELRAAGYDYVLIATPPLLGSVEARVLAASADAVLVLCPLDRMTPEHAADLAQVVAALSAPALGAVVIADGGFASPPPTREPSPPTDAASATYR